MGRIFTDRAEGTSPGPHDQCSGNPSAFDHATDSSYNEIIDRLVSRGFSDASTGEAAFLLKRVTESHLEPYLSMIETPSSGVVPSIRAANDLMTFDRRYQSILFKYIGIIEAQMRAQYSHWMGHFHGDFSMYDTSLFLRIENHVRTILHLRDEMGRKIRRSRWMTEAFVSNGERLPVDQAVECATLGTLVQLFSNTADRDVTGRVSSSFGCSKAELSSWMKTITDVRNICAHFDSYVTRRQIPSTPMAITGMPEADNRSTFYIVLIILSLLSARITFSDLNLTYANRMQCEVKNLVSDFVRLYPMGLVRLMGFHESWERDVDFAVGGQFIPDVPIEHHGAAKTT